MTDPYPDITGFKPTDTSQAPAKFISAPHGRPRDIAMLATSERALKGLTTHQTADVWIATRVLPIG